MAATQCACDTKKLPVGMPQCTQEIGRIVGFIFVPTVFVNGTTVSLAIDADFDESTLDTHVYNQDRADRFTVVTGFKNQTFDKEDPDTEDNDDGTSEILRENARMFMGKINNASNRIVDDLNSLRCAGGRVYPISEFGWIVGLTQNDDFTTLFPMPFQKGSLLADFVSKSADASEGVRLRFSLDPTVNDGQWFAVRPTDFNLFDLYAPERLPRNAVATQGTITTTTFPVTIRDTFTGALATGLPSTAFVYTNITDNTTVAVASAPEAPAGTYTITCRTGFVR